jgi:hypothetical protein
MRLRIVPATTGFTWVKQGIQTFIRQPLAMTGLFFMFMAAVSLLSVLPLLGTGLALALIPAGRLGLMAATQEATEGRFPMPPTLVTAFRSGPAKTRPMLWLGLMHMAGVLVAMMLATGVGAMLGSAPEALPEGSEVTAEMVANSIFGHPGFWASLLLQLPVIMAFWHAPALVHWHGVSPGKSLFFSFMACWSNKGAMIIFMLGWLGVVFVLVPVVVLLSSLLGSGQAISLAFYPVALLIASMFHTSLYFTFRDSFIEEDAPL